MTSTSASDIFDFLSGRDGPGPDRIARALKDRTGSEDPEAHKALAAFRRANEQFESLPAVEAAVKPRMNAGPQRDLQIKQLVAHCRKELRRREDAAATKRRRESDDTPLLSTFLESDEARRITALNDSLELWPPIMARAALQLNVKNNEELLQHPQFDEVFEAILHHVIAHMLQQEQDAARRNETRVVLRESLLSHTPAAIAGALKRTVRVVEGDIRTIHAGLRTIL